MNCVLFPRLYVLTIVHICMEVVIYICHIQLRVIPCIPMTTHKSNKRPRDEDSDPGEFDSSDAEISPHDTPPTKRSRLETSNVDVVKSTALQKLRTASRGSIGIPAVRALLEKSGSKFAAASKEKNLGLRKAVTASGARKISNVKGKEKAAR